MELMITNVSYYVSHINYGLQILIRSVKHPEKLGDCGFTKSQTKRMQEQKKLEVFTSGVRMVGNPQLFAFKLYISSFGIHK